MYLKSYLEFLNESASYENLIDYDRAGENPKKFFEYFDGFYVINLKNRKDRLKMFTEQMKASGVKDFVRIEAHDGKKNAEKVFKDPLYILDKYSDLCDIEPLVQKKNKSTIIDCFGSYACAESHRLAVMKAKADGCKKPLILEDDASPTKALFYRGTKMIEEIKKVPYDIVNMGIVRMKFEGHDHFSGKGLLRKLKQGGLTKFHAYTLNPDFYDDFLRYSLNNWHYHVDIQVTLECLKNGKSLYAFNPRPFTQLGDFSDIQQKKIQKGGMDEIAFRFPHQPVRNDSYE